VLISAQSDVAATAEVEDNLRVLLWHVVEIPHHNRERPARVGAAVCAESHEGDEAGGLGVAWIDLGRGPGSHSQAGD